MSDHERALSLLSGMEAKASAATLNATDDWAPYVAVSSDAPRAYAALRAVLEIHTLHRHGGCSACDEQQGETPNQWPCPTVRAIAEKLEGK